MFAIAAMAAGASLAGLALEGFGKVYAAEGEAASQEFLAERDKRNAEYGKLKASQLDAQLLEELNTTLANIDVTRAAANIDPSSPTTAALKAEEARLSDRARNIKVSSILAQAREDQLSSAYRRDLAGDIRTAGYISAGAGVLKGIGSLALQRGRSSSLGNSSIGDPTKLGALY
jgi:hypothetical protein